jgi:hypothetical protein
MTKVIMVLLLAYGAASLFHFAHNAEFLSDYPNMPNWLSRSKRYAAWVGLTAVGICGYLLLRRDYQTLGPCLIAAYAALSFDGLAHYSLAPFEAHSATMRLAIPLEVAAAAMLLATVAGLMAKRTWACSRRQWGDVRKVIE